MLTDGAVLGVLDPATVWLPQASAEVARARAGVDEAVRADPAELGLAAGDRPAADVEVLASTLSACEFLLATRMHAAAAAGCLPLGERGGVLAARGWSVPYARRLARCGGLAARFQRLAAVWAAGVISSEHVDPIARAADRFTAEELAALIDQLGPHWGRWSPAAVARFVTAAERMLHPPPDPTDAEVDAYATRGVSFALTADTVLLSGELPRVEGELVIAAIDAFAERLRSTAEHVPAAARRADALVQLVNVAHAADALPTRGGMPVALTVVMAHSALGDPVCTTSRGHLLTAAETRWAACDATVAPVALARRGCPAEPVGSGPGRAGCGAGPASPAARIAALAATLFDTHVPLDAGRTQRTATHAQRRAIAVRDGGCVIPGCQVPAEACQVHHLQEWADGGPTDIANLASVCWAHHRQVDLAMWTIRPSDPHAPVPRPEAGAPPGTSWPANHGAPFTITRTPRSRWRL